MSIVQIQSVTSTVNTVTSPTVSISSTSTGNFLGVLVYFGPYPSVSISSIMDNQGSTYIFAHGDNSTMGNDRSEIWYTTNTASAITSVTVNFSGIVNTAITVQEYSGINISTPLDSSITAGGSGIPLVSGNTTTNSEELILGIIDSHGSTLTSLNGPYTQDALTSSNGFSQIFAHYIVSSSGTYTSLANPSTIVDFFGLGVSFFSQPTPPLTLMLSDSIVTNDSQVSAFSISFSDSFISSDFSPQSFSIESDFIQPVTVPIVETLVNQLIPSAVKTYFRIEE